MRMVSTRGAAPAASLSEAIRAGLAPDGGLYVPERLDPSEGRAADPEGWLRDYAAGDPLEPHLADILAESQNFPTPLVPLAPGVRVLELFHGPTSAFKDVGARFLAACLRRLLDGAPVTILVATSGDTGAAVASAFHGTRGIDVVLLYPRGLVSPRQAHQLACWGGNVRTLAVQGTFDDCQRMVKAAFRDPRLAATRRLTSANSINIGRLLPQVLYYASASTRVQADEGRPASFIVPSGNLGNATACVFARAMGFPIDRIVLATNANRAVADFFAGDAWRPRPSVPTLASAMDVGDPSNMERLRWLYPDDALLRRQLAAAWVSDDAIRETIRRDAAAMDRVWCPHSAAAARVWHQLPAGERARPWVIVSTAHPAKFPEIVEPLIGRAVDVPPSLEELLCRPRQEEEVPATLDALRAALR